MSQTIVQWAGSSKSTPASAEYPQGSAKNVSAPGAGDGTPWVAPFVNQTEAFFQAIMAEAGTTPNGTIDTATASQWFDSAKIVFQTTITGDFTENVRILKASPELRMNTDPTDVATTTRFSITYGAAGVVNINAPQATISGFDWKHGASSLTGMEMRTNAGDNTIVDVTITGGVTMDGGGLFNTDRAITVLSDIGGDSNALRIANQANNALHTSWQGTGGLSWVTLSAPQSSVESGGDTSTANAAASVLRLGRNVTTSRSINAGGTINASGADLAEYHYKADDCGDVAKGDIVGIDENNKVTDVFDNAVRFAIKSTNPFVIGGVDWDEGFRDEPTIVTLDAYFDAQDKSSVGDEPAQPNADAFDDIKLYEEAVTQWHTEHNAWDDRRDAWVVEHTEAYEAVKAQYEIDHAEWYAEHEALRATVDRIAYCGNVPVNGVDAAKTGFHIIAAKATGGGIKATTVDDDNITLKQFVRLRVGEVVCYKDGQAIAAVGVK